MKKNILILTSDPYSINYEIINKSLKFFKRKNKNNYTFIGCKNDLSKLIKSRINFLNFIDVKREKNTKKYIKKCFDLAFSLIKNKKADGLINLPLDKKYLPNNFKGVTEYIAHSFNKINQETMLLYSDNFSVSPATTHIPLRDVSGKISKKILKKNVINIYYFYKNILKKKIKIGILGFNPHNGKDFKKKTEESKKIIPVIKELKNKKFSITGPIVPDSAFNDMNKTKINCLIGHYHDQVLTTFKYINKFKGINITLGLPFIRISPDHGPAKNIINKNMANPESFLYALKFFEKYYKTI